VLKGPSSDISPTRRREEIDAVGDAQTRVLGNGVGGCGEVPSLRRDFSLRKIELLELVCKLLKWCVVEESQPVPLAVFGLSTCRKGSFRVLPLLPSSGPQNRNILLMYAVSSLPFRGTKTGDLLGRITHPAGFFFVFGNLLNGIPSLQQHGGLPLIRFEEPLGFPDATGNPSGFFGAAGSPVAEPNQLKVHRSNPMGGVVEKVFLTLPLIGSSEQSLPESGLAVVRIRDDLLSVEHRSTPCAE